ncbi:MAG TPA: aldehyde oxidase, partial [Rhizobiales bacterium]|nr:aldehyde oxidase [Hyphomicrobiales bacterium]
LAIAALDAGDFPVTWRELAAIEDPVSAMAEGAGEIHAGRSGNIMVRGLVERGDVRAGLAAADHVSKVAVSTPFIEHAYIEPEAGYAVRKGDRLEIHVTTQAPFMDRDDVAAIMGVRNEDVRILPTACGGGFGSKLDLSVQPFIAIAAWKLGRPAALVYSRPESMMSTTKRHPAQMRLEAGCTKDGRITGFDFDGIFDTGAYASWGPTVANRVPVHAGGPYVIENYRARTAAVHTNAPPSGAFRGFGVPQAAIAQEAVFDDLAIKAGIDRLQFRLINALKNGVPTVTGQVFDKGVGITACLEALLPHWDRALADAAAFNDADHGPLKKGVGIGTCWYGCGNTALPNPSTIKIGMTAAGEIILHQGAVDIGQGSNTVIAQIVADTLAIPLAQITLAGPDTDITPDAGKTSASRQTYVSGLAARHAALSLRRSICALAGVPDKSVIEIGAGTITLNDNGVETQVDLTSLTANRSGYVIMAEETFDPPSSPLDDKGQGAPYPVFGYGAQMMELTVDTRLGTVRLNKLTAAHDVGRAINPVLVEGQIEGGSAQGIGLALMEEYIPGRTENLHDYLVPTIGDVPEIESIIIEETDPAGPFGAKGLGEHVLIPTAPAILSAIRHATGARITRLPATPHRIRAAIRALEDGS